MQCSYAWDIVKGAVGFETGIHEIKNPFAI